MNGRVDDMAFEQRRAKARRNAWLLGAVVLLFYFGVLSWYLLRAV